MNFLRGKFWNFSFQVSLFKRANMRCFSYCLQNAKLSVENCITSCNCFFRLPVVLPVVCIKLKHNLFVRCLITFSNNTICSFVQ